MADAAAAAAGALLAFIACSSRPRVAPLLLPPVPTAATDAAEPEEEAEEGDGTGAASFSATAVTPLWWPL